MDMSFQHERMCVSVYVRMGKSYMNRLKRVGKSTDLYGTSLRKRLLVIIIKVYKLLHVALNNFE